MHKRLNMEYKPLAPIDCVSCVYEFEVNDMINHAKFVYVMMMKFEIVVDSLF